MSDLEVLVVDDDEVARNLLKEILAQDGIACTTASSAEEALELFSRKYFPLIISDVRMLELSGLDLLRRVKAKAPQTIIILLTAFASMSSAMEATKEGAFDYLSKPFRIQDFKKCLHKALREYEARCQGNATHVTEKLAGKNTDTPDGLIGQSPQMLEISKLMARAASSTATVLLTGESGTGKEMVARGIHENSERKNFKFVAINCAALPEGVLESELFGHVKGSFTNAMETRKGLFEEAHRGTLFLDEIGDIPPATQVKLLRVLQEGEIRPVGSSEVRKIDARIVAATHRDLVSLVAKNEFREDLFYRLNVVRIHLPPLRERKLDIPLLVDVFLKKFSQKHRKPAPIILPEALEALSEFPWPGNVRQLQNVIENIIALNTSTQLHLEDLPADILSFKSSPESEVRSIAAPSLEAREKEHILATLRETQFNKTKAAEILKIDRATLYRKLQRYGIQS